jgi:hypothetical protein
VRRTSNRNRPKSSWNSAVSDRGAKNLGSGIFPIFQPDTGILMPHSSELSANMKVKGENISTKLPSASWHRSDDIFLPPKVLVQRSIDRPVFENVRSTLNVRGTETPMSGRPNSQPKKLRTNPRSRSISASPDHIGGHAWLWNS